MRRWSGYEGLSAAKVCCVLIAALLLASAAPWAAVAGESVNFWFWFSPPEEDILHELVDTFQANTGIAVTATNVAYGGGDYVSKLLTAFAGGIGPDVFFIAPGHMRAPLSDAYAMDLTRYIERDRDEIDFDDFLEAQHLELQNDGKWKCLPYDFSIFAFYYNSDIFDQVGVAYPDESWAWGDVLDVGPRLAVYDNQGGVSRWALGSTGAFEGLWSEGTYQSFGGELFAIKNGVVRSVANNSGVIRTLEVVEELTQARIVPRPGESGPFLEGKSAIIVGGSWSTTQLRDTASFNFDVAMLPAGDDGRRVITGSGGCWAASTSAQDPEAAWELVKWLSGPEGIRAFVVDPIRSIPARKSLMLPWIEQISASQLPPHSAHTFVDSVLKYGSSPSLLDLNTWGVLSKYVREVRTQSMSPSEAAANLERELNNEIQSALGN